MSGKLRLNGATSGYSELQAPDVAGDQTFTLPATGGTLSTVGYQQGVWTPTFVSTSVTGGSLAGTPYANKVWSRIGNLVSVNYEFNVSTGTPGNISVNDAWVFDGLPYPAELFSTLSQAWTSGSWDTGNRWFMQAFANPPSQLKWGGSFAGNTTTVRAQKTWYCSAQYVTGDTTWQPINGATIS